ncbi:Panacea domain-containing protein [Pseudonocardia zijingensis]|uniref:Antitoxin SocA-like Panacea domain-containing protein n=1 Tax=Pseudonocardia zijingensis TaxID=153376 RepID=A0ABP3YQJ0_9PSEU
MNEVPQPAFSHDLDVHAVANYFIRLDALRLEPDVTPLKLAKLLYLAQANYLASTGQRLFSEDVEAFDNGPVVHREWRRNSGKQIIAVRESAAVTEEVDLPGNVIEFLDAVWARYKDYSASRIWELTHEQDPWKRNYRPNEYRVQIPDSDMITYFRESVPATERVFHTSVVIMPDDFLDEDDADAFAAKFAESTQR